MNTNHPLTASGALTELALKQGIDSWEALLDYIRQIPYGRNESRTDFSLVLKNKKGTCSTKHGLLRSIAAENNLVDVQLILGMYAMTELNTPGIRSILSKYNLEYIPEAHCYLKIKGQRLDLTFPDSDIRKLEFDILEEQIIEPLQVGVFKVQFHQDYLKKWILNKNIPYSFEEIWTIREQCIQNLGV